MASRGGTLGPGALALLLLPLTCLKRYRGSPPRLLLGILFALISFGALSGCGTGGYFSQIQQTYVITVTGTSGTNHHRNSHRSIGGAMNKLTQVLVYALLPSLSLTALAQRSSNTVDAYATFSEMHANAPVGGCGCFWINGGLGGFSVPVWRNFSAVVESGGHTTDHIPGFNTGLSLFYGMGGVRMRVPNHTRFQPFGQALFGGVHGFDGYFPAPVGKLPTSYDTSIALTVGGGLDIPVSRHIWIRAFQADYFYSELRNLQGDRQNQFRIGAGVLFRGPALH
jgi:hypothetical protein